MKIAISINTSWNIYNFRSGLVRFLQQEGHTVVTVAPMDEYASKLEQELGCKHYPVVMDNKGTNPIKDLQLYYAYKKVYGKIAPDVILQYTIKPNIYGTLAAHAMKIPVINNVSGLGTIFINPHTLASKAGRWLYKRAFRFPKKVFFQNEDDRSIFIQRKLVNENITDVLPGSGVDLKKFPFTSAQKKQKTVFLMIARVLYDKGVMEYGQAAKDVTAQFPEVECWLLGVHDNSAGSLSAADLAQITENGITYLGSTDKVMEKIQQSDCVVLPSYREGTSKTLLEALSVGRPIITSDVPGCRETVIHEQNGFLCNVKSAESLATSMKKFLALNEESRWTMGVKGRELAEEKFDENIVFQKYKEAINEI